MKKKPIPDVSDILEAFDNKNKFAIKHPAIAKEKAMEDLRNREEDINAMAARDFNTITLGDYISAAHVYNREIMGGTIDAEQRSAYFTLFAFEERAKRICEHFSYIQ